MIRTVWPYLALMLLVAGAFPMLERATGWRLFKVMPPIVMTYLLTRLSGVPLLEKKLARTRPDYAAYVARTSSFVPLPPKPARS